VLSVVDPTQASADSGRRFDELFRHYYARLIGPTQRVLGAEVRAEVQAVLATLPDRQRACLLLRHAGHSYAEIAATVGIALGSVGVYLARAERAFRITYEATTLSRDRE
jgi:DNA-directed RNA polymerase specialized sigma24 family protein